MHKQEFNASLKMDSGFFVQNAFLELILFKQNKVCLLCMVVIIGFAQFCVTPKNNSLTDAFSDIHSWLNNNHNMR